jgi:hypothetical protein
MEFHLVGIKNVMDFYVWNKNFIVIPDFGIKNCYGFPLMEMAKILSRIPEFN